jgi:hypothetical protein
LQSEEKAEKRKGEEDVSVIVRTFCLSMNISRDHNTCENYHDWEKHHWNRAPGNILRIHAG